jgi:hypothetical protein
VVKKCHVDIIFTFFSFRHTSTFNLTTSQHHSSCFENQTMTVSSNVLLALSLVVTSTAFAPAYTSTNSNVVLYATSSSNESNRRQMLQKSIIPALTVASVGLVGGGSPLTASARTTGADNPSNQYAPDFVQKYEDFQPSPEGWQFKDVKIGTGELNLESGDRAVFDWSGYTIGYFGRPFEAKGYVLVVVGSTSTVML